MEIFETMGPGSIGGYKNWIQSGKLGNRCVLTLSLTCLSRDMFAFGVCVRRGVRWSRSGALLDWLVLRRSRRRYIVPECAPFRTKYNPRVCWLLEARAVLKRHRGVCGHPAPCRHNRIVTYTPLHCADSCRRSCTF